MKEQELLALCHDVCERARKEGATAAETIATWDHTVETSIENSDIHSVEANEEVVFGLRVLVGRSLGFITANTSDPAVLARLSAEAVAQARATPEDPFNDFPAPEPVAAIPGLSDDATAGVTVEQTTDTAATILERIRSADARVRVDSGSVSASTSVTALVSTTGIELAQRETVASGFVFGMAVDGDDVASFDNDGDTVRAFDALSARLDRAADRFVLKCLGGLGAAKGRSYKGEIVLSPEAVAEFLLPNLITAIAADAVRKGRSRLSGKVGSAIASDMLTVLEDGTLRGGVASSAFDREGVPLQRQVLLDRGVLTTYLYNHYEARAGGGGAHSTGNASGSASTLPGIGPSYLELLPGTVGMDDMTSGEKPVVWVGRFSGSSNSVTGEFSGVVKNGFFCENGRKRPLRETLIAGDLFDVIGRIVAVSAERRLIEGTTLLPAVRLGGVSVTAG